MDEETGAKVDCGTADFQKARSAFEELRKKSAREAAQFGLRHLSEHGQDETGRVIVPWLAYGFEYAQVLIDPAALEEDEAIQSAQVMRNADKRFFTKFAALSEDATLSYPHFLHALSIMQAVALPQVLASWLRSFVHHPVKEIRSKAAKETTAKTPNLTTVERLFKSSDARVRANAVEALWSLDNDSAIELFRKALLDSSYRVVVNALVGLQGRNVGGARETLVAMSGHRSPAVRRSAAWGLGEIKDAEANRALERMAAEDPEEPVRKWASLQLERSSRRAGDPPDTQTPRASA